MVEDVPEGQRMLGIHAGLLDRPALAKIPGVVPVSGAGSDISGLPGTARQS